MSETICAVSTPEGRGGISVVRISGGLVQTIAKAVVGQIPHPRVATLSTFTSKDGSAIDTGLAVFFPEPHSFTGEDVLELQGHANPVLQSMLIDRICELGARLANPGEFTERAFVNDRMDLTQAEAVMDLISSASKQASQAALRSLQGGFSEQVLEVDQKLLDVRVFVESAIDFVDEDIDFLEDSDLKDRIADVTDSLKTLMERCEQGIMLQHGYQLVIAGAPNVGKSSLFNALLNEDRAIVTHIAGTTRDTLDATISLEGLPVTLIDTAGLHETHDPIEAEGILRTESALTGSDLVLWVVDDTQFGEESPPSKAIVVHNKCDLSNGEFGPRSDGSVGVSALKGVGLRELKTVIRKRCGYEPRDDAFAGRPRHLKSLRNAQSHLQSASDNLRHQHGEIAAESLRLAHASLGEVIGSTTTDDLLGEIFSKFCIGK